MSLLYWLLVSQFLYCMKQVQTQQVKEYMAKFLRSVAARSLTDLTSQLPSAFLRPEYKLQSTSPHSVQNLPSGGAR